MVLDYNKYNLKENNMSHSSNTRKKQIKRCRKNGKYTFVVNGSNYKYVDKDGTYKLVPAE